MSFREKFEIPAKFKMWSMILMAVGLVSILAGYFIYGQGDEHANTRFWGVLLYNSVFFLLIVNASMFFICATTLAMGGWQMSFRRVAEAISTAVIPIGIISGVILLSLVLGHKHHIYHWITPDPNDHILMGKIGFLNPTFFIVWTVLTLLGWIFLGAKMRSISRELDNGGPLSPEEGKKYIFKNTIWGSLYLVWFGLTVASTVPWLWLMSIDAHWYSTMYSWYTFASTFVAGMALITLFVIYLKNQGYLELVNQEHLHDLGKFMFAFSVFWTYLWFSQYMLIWYANIPEETVYFKHRVQGPYRGIFFLNLIINFIAPLLILMRRSSKRNYTLLVFMAVLIIFGHWIDFYQMVIASLSKEHVELGLFDFGVAAGFIGLIMWATGNALSKHSLINRHHPFLKESIIHHT
ncbi:quinol:cytochrome C oxidoreductase [Flavihumibacter sp. CACIAM 22H1]|uniref:quinol:cytochrome C oxidoreductase n=1 Tax=Flavihumibacter sp. CACIAM 22H1 TaxID=1812911 RepID=UPI0007A8F6AF|nr:quinol:cytochrome C oxidoreductase [Flavihumibacter sp. CACIAM 22H1]KYP13656.1 MAG: quinol:cytochrome C oxidoreductase [Flavihumibacter sp. CACIAM 22H1]